MAKFYYIVEVDADSQSEATTEITDAISYYDSITDCWLGDLQDR